MPQEKLTDNTDAPISVFKEPKYGLYHIGLDEEALVVGRCYFKERNGERIFYHTEVPSEYGGRGLASTLIAESVKATQQAGLTIVAMCPMVSDYLKKHEEELSDSFRTPRPEDIHWIREQLRG